MKLFRELNGKSPTREVALKRKQLMVVIGMGMATGS